MKKAETNNLYVMREKTQTTNLTMFTETITFVLHADEINEYIYICYVTNKEINFRQAFAGGLGWVGYIYLSFYTLCICLSIYLCLLFTGCLTLLSIY